MTNRIEAAAQAIYLESRSVIDPGPDEYSEEWATWEQARETKRNQDRAEARAAIAASDAVMFSEEAIERAAIVSGYKPSVVRAIAAALKGSETTRPESGVAWPS